MPQPKPLSPRELRALRHVLTFVSTSRPDIQDDVVRLVARIDAILTTPQPKEK